MSILWSTWEQTQHNLIQDLIDLFLPPSYTFSVDKNYPRTASIDALINDRFNSLDLPKRKLLRFEQLLEESGVEQFPHRLGDWATLFAYDVLEGFGPGSASKLSGAVFEGLKQLATTWGLYLARDLERVLNRYELFATVGDIMADATIGTFYQIPAKELGETIRESITPAYVRAGEAVAYELALFDNNQARMRQGLEILLASDAELEREITSIFSEYSTNQLGRQAQRIMAEAMSELRELFSSKEFKEQFINVWPIAWQRLSWYLGHRLQLNLESDPERINRLLEAISRHKEIAAVLEQYRYRYGWQGDRNKAINLGWQAVAPKCFGLSRKVEDIKEDEEQEKLIGVAQGLEDYTNKNPAIVAIQDGFLGKLQAYLKKAAKNQELDYWRKQETNGNRILTKAKHAEDLCSQDEDGDKELSDKEILSREKEEYHSSRDPVAEEVEAKEISIAWYSHLTEQERTAIDLKVALDNEEEIALRMGISQQRVSQLLGQAQKKWPKFNR